MNFYRFYKLLSEIAVKPNTWADDQTPLYYMKKSKDRLDYFDKALKMKNMELANHAKKQIDDNSAEDDFKYRSLYQTSLGDFIKELERLPKSVMVDKLENPHLYKDDPWDIAFEKGIGKMTSKELIDICSSLVGKLFPYSDGNIQINEKSFVWIVANIDARGQKLVDVNPDGTFVTKWAPEDGKYDHEVD